MNQLSKIDFKELDQMTSEIAEKFFLAKQIKDSDNTELINEKEFIEGYSFESFLSKVEEAYNALSDLEKNLINNEFFYQSYSQWWKPLYSKATFYRYKKEAMQKFLGAIYGL